jgi:hypothetical protein
MRRNSVRATRRTTRVARAHEREARYQIEKSRTRAKVEEALSRSFEARNEVDPRSARIL